MVVVHHPTDSCAINPPQPECSLRRRNVSWEAPICRDNNGSNSAASNSSPRSGEVDGPIDDDGFESLNGKSSGGEDSSNATVPSEKYYEKLPYTNTWLSGIPGKSAEVAAPEKDSRSDSDTDTLRNTPTAQQDHLTSVKPAAIPPRRHLSSESGIELQRHERPGKSLLDEDNDQRDRLHQQNDQQDPQKGIAFDEKLESSGDTDEENDFDLHHSESSHHHSSFHHHHHLHHQHLSEGTESNTTGSNIANTDSEYFWF